MSTNIPTLDLAGDRGETAKQLVAALEDPGFLYIKNVQGYDPGIEPIQFSHTSTEISIF